MSTTIHQFPLELSHVYLSWAQTKDSTMEIEHNVTIQSQTSQFEATEASVIQVVFVRTRLIYPLRDSPTPAMINNTINIGSDDARIQKILKEYLLVEPYEKDVLRFPDDTNGRYNFKLRFFPDQSTLQQSLAKEKESHDQLAEPQFSTCCLL